MNEVLINALLARIRAEQMTVEQAPVPLQEVIAERLLVEEG